MNDRIRFVDERTVKVTRNALSDPPMSIYGASAEFQLHFGKQQPDAGYLFDYAGAAALTEAITAYQRDGDFREFRPAPKIRPYTPVEAAAHLGRNVRDPNGIGWLREVGLSMVHVSGNTFTYQEFLSKCLWADDFSPCGIQQ